MEDNNQINVRTYQRDIKQHLYDHQNEESATKYDCEAFLKLTNDGNKSRETNTKDCETKQRNNLKEKELSHIDLLRRLKIKHGNKLTELRNEFRRMSSDIMSRSENITRATKEIMDQELKEEVVVIEEKNRNKGNCLSSQEG